MLGVGCDSDFECNWIWFNKSGSDEMKNPCHNCEKRFVGCHGSCEDYKSFREEKDNLKQKLQLEMVADHYAEDRQSKVVSKMAKQKQRNRRDKRIGTLYG